MLIDRKRAKNILGITQDASMKLLKEHPYFPKNHGTGGIKAKELYDLDAMVTFSLTVDYEDWLSKVRTTRRDTHESMTPYNQMAKRFITRRDNYETTTL